MCLSFREGVYRTEAEVFAFCILGFYKVRILDLVKVKFCKL
jgi:hypothetical protein